MTLKATPQNMLGQPNVNFRKNDFDAAIWAKGYDIIIEKAVRCPCEGVDGIPLSSCENCQGTGYFYINSIETIGLVTGINKDTQYKEWSAELIGTISLSVRDNEDNTQEKVAFYDRVTLIKKRSDQPDIFGYHSEVLPTRQTLGGQNFIFLSYKPQEILDVFLFNGDKQPLIRLNKADFSIKGDNPYVLLINASLTQNNVVSVRYKHDIQYHVIDVVHEVRYSTELDKDGRVKVLTMPTNAICRRAHLVQVQRANFDGGGIQNNSYL